MVSFHLHDGCRIGTTEEGRVKLVALSDVHETIVCPGAPCLRRRGRVWRHEAQLKTSAVVVAPVDDKDRRPSVGMVARAGMYWSVENGGADQACSEASGHDRESNEARVVLGIRETMVTLENVRRRWWSFTVLLTGPGGMARRVMLTRDDGDALERDAPELGSVRWR